MILVKLKDGTVYENDTSLGLNLDKMGIQDCLLDTGEYNLTFKKSESLFGTDWIRINREDVQEIIED
ncbi:hypothetical protein ABE354_23540 [Brevibacillus laterosporus]|uniref:hypothetical protein n=1 Tax=Brevibacillus laterosporus TaxID=1465 RepID=UPI003D204ACA